jgi:hypothetical protein
MGDFYVSRLQWRGIYDLLIETVELTTLLLLLAMGYVKCKRRRRVQPQASLSCSILLLCLALDPKVLNLLKQTVDEVKIHL